MARSLQNDDSIETDRPQYAGDCLHGCSSSTRWGGAYSSASCTGKDGETTEQAALRELVEETGLRRESVGPEVARRQVAMQLPDGEDVVSDERYFLFRVANSTLSKDDWTDFEREVMVENRWWSVEELARTEVAVWPENLPEMIEAALR